MCKVSSAAQLPALILFLPCFPNQESHSVSPRNEDTKSGRRDLCRVSGSMSAETGAASEETPSESLHPGLTSRWGVTVGDISE